MKDKVQVFYSKRDFIPYVFQLVVVAAACHIAFPSVWVHALVDTALVYLGVNFVMRRGAAFDLATVGMIIRGVFHFPRYLVQIMWMGRRDNLLNLGIFLAALGLEKALTANGLVTSSFWTDSLPYMYPVAVVFLVTCAFRTVILIEHLRKMPTVRAILQGSGWRHQLAQTPLWNHLLHGYVTGNLTTLCIMVPFVLFWQLTGLTYLREVLLVAIGVSVHCADALWVQRKVPVSFWLAMQRQTVPPVFYASHEQSHTSRFYFTVFHGPHHDAIPCAVMAATEAGFLEAIDRSIHFAFFTKSTFEACGTHVIFILLAMMIHGYIPGVFPYSHYTARQSNHHVVHHFGSARPYSVAVEPCLEVDVQNGYRRDNAILRWFVKIVEEHEHIDATAMFNLDGSRSENGGNLRPLTLADLLPAARRQESPEASLQNAA